MRKFFLFLITVTQLIYAAEWRITANPCPRSMAGAITDIANQRMILFGGGNYRLPWGTYLNDVWALDFNNESWKLLTPPGSLPSGRYDVAMTYDPIRNRVLIYGGRTDVNFFHDVWALNLTPGSESWIQLFPSGTPPNASDGPTAIMDPINNRVIIFGGSDANGQAYNETWELNLNNLTWTLLNPSGTPPPARGSHIAIYDPNGHRMVIFGGSGAATYNDVWALDLTLGNESWQQLFPTGTTPGFRMRHWGIFDSENRDLVIGFGFYYPGYFLYYNDVWALNLTSLAWRQIIPVGVNIEGRRGSCAVYDPFHHRTFIFGGDQYYDYYFGDTYVLIHDTLVINENKENMVIQPYIKIIPNPVNFPCQINAFIPSCKERVAIKVVDVSGKIVKTLIEEARNSGNYIIEWNGFDDNGKRLPSGTYFIILNIDNSTECRKIVALK